MSRPSYSPGSTWAHRPSGSSPSGSAGPGATGTDTTLTRRATGTARRRPGCRTTTPSQRPRGPRRSDVGCSGESGPGVWPGECLSVEVLGCVRSTFRCSGAFSGTRRVLGGCLVLKRDSGRDRVDEGPAPRRRGSDLVTSGVDVHRRVRPRRLVTGLRCTSNTLQHKPGVSTRGPTVKGTSSPLISPHAPPDALRPRL